MLTGCALYLGETLPADKVGSHGFAVNLGVTLGISVVLNFGILVSTNDSWSWLFVAMIPLVVAIANFFLWLLCFKNEPIGFCIQNRDKKDYKEQAYSGIRRLYHTGDEMDAIYQIYEERMNPDDQKTDPFMLDQRNTKGTV